MKAVKYLILSFVAAATLTACDKEYNAPEALRSDFDKMYPTAVDVEWEKRGEYAVAEFHIPGEGDCEAWYKNEVWVGSEYDIQFKNLPDAVQSAFLSAYGVETPVDDVDRLERPNKDDVYFIEAEIYLNDNIADIYLDYNASGELLRSSVEVEPTIYYYL